MSDSPDITDVLEVVAKILLRCWIFGFVLLFIWFGAFMSGAVYKLHGPLMDLSTHDPVSYTHLRRRRCSRQS